MSLTRLTVRASVVSVLRVTVAVVAAAPDDSSAILQQLQARAVLGEGFSMLAEGRASNARAFFESQLNSGADAGSALRCRLADYKILIKPRITRMVVITAAIGFFVAVRGGHGWTWLMLLGTLGGTAVGRTDVILHMLKAS